MCQRTQNATPQPQYCLGQQLTWDGLADCLGCCAAFTGAGVLGACFKFALPAGAIAKALRVAGVMSEGICWDLPKDLLAEELGDLKPCFDA